jgi:hypothetical protein
MIIIRFNKNKVNFDLEYKFSVLSNFNAEENPESISMIFVD